MNKYLIKIAEDYSKGFTVPKGGDLYVRMIRDNKTGKIKVLTSPIAFKDSEFALKKIAEQSEKATYGNAAGTQLRSTGRGIVEGLGGAVAGAGLGAGTMLLAHRVGLGKTKFERAAKLSGYWKVDNNILPDSRTAAKYIGYGVGATLGGIAGSIHGPLASTKKSLDRFHEERK